MRYKYKTCRAEKCPNLTPGGNSESSRQNCDFFLFLQNENSSFWLLPAVSGRLVGFNLNEFFCVLGYEHAAEPDSFKSSRVMVLMNPITLGWVRGISSRVCLISLVSMIN